MATDPIRAVIEAQIQCRMEGRLEDDIAQHYASDVVLLSAEGVHRGHDGVRELASILQRYAREADYEIHALHVEGAHALELWSARSPERSLPDGADTFMVCDGRIMTQSIHFSARPRVD